MFISDVIFTHSCVVIPDGCELVGAQEEMQDILTGVFVCDVFFLLLF